MTKPKSANSVHPPQEQDVAIEAAQTDVLSVKPPQ